MRRRLNFRIEAWLAASLLWLVGRLRAETASNLGGAVARMIGPRLRVSRVADANLRLALPELDAFARAGIIRGVWDNLGRTAAEFPHVHRLAPTEAGPGFEVVGEGNVRALLDGEGPGIFFSAHMANWEVMLRAFTLYGREPATFYRAASNPLVDRMIVSLRGGAGNRQLAKGRAGARAAMEHLRGGGLLGLLADQKMNDGVAATLFGHTAMTAGAPAALALRFGCPLVPVRVERLGPARFRITAEPPLAHPATGDRAADVLALTQAVNDRIEAWVRARPEQWLWLHRRWPRERTG
jgi:KDO2-lipid IV(A) lauroyltransferase